MNRNSFEKVSIKKIPKKNFFSEFLFSEYKLLKKLISFSRALTNEFWFYLDKSASNLYEINIYKFQTFLLNLTFAPPITVSKAASSTSQSSLIQIEKFVKVLLIFWMRKIQKHGLLIARTNHRFYGIMMRPALDVLKNTKVWLMKILVLSYFNRKRLQSCNWFLLFNTNGD